MDDKKTEYVVRSFWRRIEPYKNDYKKELPDKCPVEFKASMETALLHLKSEKECIDCVCNDVCSLKQALLKPLDEHKRILNIGYYELMSIIASNCNRYINKHELPNSKGD